MARKGNLGGLVITRAELNEWAGRKLTDDEVGQLAECVQHSSIPEAVATIVVNFGIVPDDESRLYIGQPPPLCECGARHWAHVAE
jgi:hypothetical protein